MLNSWIEDIGEFQRAEAEVTEPEGAIVMVRVEFAQQLRGRTLRREELEDGSRWLPANAAEFHRHLSSYKWRYRDYTPARARAAENK